MKNFIIFSAFFLCFSSNVSAGQKYKSNENFISIEFPNDWVVSGGNVNSTIAKASYRDSLGRVAMVTVGVIKMENESEYFHYLSVDPMDLSKTIMKQYPALDTELIYAHKTTVDNHFAVEICFKLNVIHSGRIIRMYCIPRQYSLLTISLSIDENIYDKYKQAMEDVIFSVDLLEKDLKMNEI